MKTFKQIERDAREFYPEWAKSFDPANILGLTDRENTMVAFATDFCEHEISNDSTSQRWIPVVERLPETLQEVVLTKNDTSFSGYYDGNSKRFFNSNHNWILGVSAWQPLPKPNQD